MLSQVSIPKSKKSVTTVWESGVKLHGGRRSQMNRSCWRNASLSICEGWSTQQAVLLSLCCAVSSFKRRTPEL